VPNAHVQVVEVISNVARRRRASRQRGRRWRIDGVGEQLAAVVHASEHVVSLAVTPESHIAALRLSSIVCR
jgi:hypothetical protein